MLLTAAAATLVVGLAVGLAVTWPRPALDGVVGSRFAAVAGPLRPIATTDLVWNPSPFVVGPIHPGSFRAWQIVDEQVVQHQVDDRDPLGRERWWRSGASNRSTAAARTASCRAGGRRAEL